MIFGKNVGNNFGCISNTHWIITIFCVLRQSFCGTFKIFCCFWKPAFRMYGQKCCRLGRARRRRWRQGESPIQKLRRKGTSWTSWTGRRTPPSSWTSTPCWSRWRTSSWTWRGCWRDQRIQGQCSPSYLTPGLDHSCRRGQERGLPGKLRMSNWWESCHSGFSVEEWEGGVEWECRGRQCWPHRGQNTQLSQSGHSHSPQRSHWRFGQI